jgi:hypothetical protein
VRTKLSGSFLAPGTAEMRPVLQGLESVVDFADRRLPVVWMVICEVIVDVLKVFCGGWGPADAHSSGAQHLLQAGVHFLLFNELAAVGLCDALAHGGAKASIFLKQAQGGFLHKSLGVGAFLVGDLRQLSFLFGGEMEFHRLKAKSRERACQAWGGNLSKASQQRLGKESEPEQFPREPGFAAIGKRLEPAIFAAAAALGTAEAVPFPPPWTALRR